LGEAALVDGALFVIGTNIPQLLSAHIFTANFDGAVDGDFCLARIWVVITPGLVVGLDGGPDTRHSCAIRIGTKKEGASVGVHPAIDTIGTTIAAGKAPDYGATVVGRVTKLDCLIGIILCPLYSDPRLFIIINGGVNIKQLFLARDRRQDAVGGGGVEDGMQPGPRCINVDIISEITFAALIADAWG